MKYISRWLTIVLGLGLSSEAFAMKQIVLLADEWCPYNCSNDQVLPGFIIEIAQLALSSSETTVVYKTRPWSRSIIEVREGKAHGLVGAGKDEVPDFIFPVIEQGRALHTFYTLPNNPWRYDGLASLEKIRLGVIQDYSYGNLYKDYILPNEGSPNIVTLTGDSALSRSIEMLQLNRIDVLVEEKYVLQHHLFKNHNVPVANSFVEAGIAFSEKIYIAFSPALEESKIYAEKLSKTMKSLRKSGQLKEILNKYGLKDWVKP